MYCYNCGANISENAVFCRKCGAKVGGASQTQQPSYVQPKYGQPAYGETYGQPPYGPPLYGQPHRKEKTKAALLIAGGAVLLIAIALVLIFVVFKAGSNDTVAHSNHSSSDNDTSQSTAPDNNDTPQNTESESTTSNNTGTNTAGGDFVGISMPTKLLERWNKDGATMKAELEAFGYEVDLQYADGDAISQASQIESMIIEGVDVLVVTAADGGALGSVLAEARQANIPVIALDRMLMNTENCDYYVTFDNYEIGEAQGLYIADALGLDSGLTGPFTLECFGGDPGDNNAFLFNQGAMSVLQPYIDSGVLYVKSGQISWPDQVAIATWNAQAAQSRMDNLITAYYFDENIDAVLSPNDSISQGIVASLKNNGYGTADRPFPVLTGQDCEIINVGMIVRGEQSMSVFKDTRELVDQTVVMVDALLSGENVPVNATYPNGTIDIPAFNCEIKFADKDNWRAVLIDTGYYTEEQILG